MSGMDLLLQAAGCSGGFGPTTKPIDRSLLMSMNSVASCTTEDKQRLMTSSSSTSLSSPATASAAAASSLGLHRSKSMLSRTHCSSSGSLPPKKRMRRFASVEIMDGRSAALHTALNNRRSNNDPFELRQQRMKKNESFGLLRSDTSLSTLGMSVASSKAGRTLLGASNGGGRYDSSYTMVSRGSSSLSGNTTSTSRNSEWSTADMSNVTTRPQGANNNNSRAAINFLELCKAGLILPNRGGGTSKGPFSSGLQLNTPGLNRPNKNLISMVPKINKVSSSIESSSVNSIPKSSNNTMMKKCRSVSDASSTNSSTPAKKKETLEVKDLDGNDMGMGYFSSMSSLK